KQAGVNRVWWDLKYESTKRPRLRTSPVGHPEIGLRAEGWRPFPLEGSFAPLAASGTYTVKLKVGQTELTRPVVVKKDPNSPGSEDGIRVQPTLTLDIWNRLNAIVDLIDQIELVRRQLADVKTALQSDARWKSYVADADELDQKLLAVERVFFDPRMTSVGDSFYYPPGLYSKLQVVARGIIESDFQTLSAECEVGWMVVREAVEQEENLVAIMVCDVG